MNAPTPFSDEDFEALAALLETQSPRDLDGVLGLFHAVASAPGLVAPSAWLPLIAPNGPGDTQLLPLAFQLYNDVLASLDRGMAMLPEPHDVEGCASFANGYVDGASLDPEWIGNPSRWAFAAWAAYLADRNDLVPAGMRAQLATLGTKDKAKAATRLEMAALVKTAHESFREVRQPGAKAQATAGPRVGRNDPCPCGSGKKFKRCCIDKKSAQS